MTPEQIIHGLTQEIATLRAELEKKGGATQMTQEDWVRLRISQSVELAEKRLRKVGDVLDNPVKEEYMSLMRAAFEQAARETILLLSRNGELRIPS